MQKIAVILFISLNILNAQETDTTKSGPWNFGTVLNASFSQVSLSNWASGGENSLSLTGLSNSNIDYKKDKISWENTFEFAYGIIKQGNASVEKSDDKIDIASKFGRKLDSVWRVAAAVNFQSQFAPGYDTITDPVTGEEMQVLVSEFMSPGYITSSIGIEYKPREEFFVFISPLTGKTTIVLNDELSDAGAFGVDPGDNIRNELGSYIKSGLKVPVMENVTFQTKLSLFSGYENPDEIDVNWETLFLLKVNKYITTNFSTNLIYDRDVTTKTQFKEVLSVGVAFEFK